MMLAEFHDVVDGYIAAHASDAAGGPTDEAEYLAVLAEEMAAGRA